MPATKKKIIAASVFLSAFVPYPGTGNWELKKQEKGITVYSRNVSSSDFREVKATMQVKTSLSAIVAVLKDVPSYTDWIYLCVDSELLKEVTEQEIYYYTHIDAPWPASDRDMAVHSKITQDSTTLVVTSDSKGVPDYISVKGDIVRIPKLYSTWTFTPINDSIVDVVYLLSVDPGGLLPSWLVNMGVVTGPYQSLLKFKEMVQKEKYKRSKYSFIKEW